MSAKRLARTLPGLAGACCAAVPLLGGCAAVGPDYARPSAPVPAAYKAAKGWDIARPQDVADRGRWWAVFGDPTLDRLEAQIDIGNQNLRATEAAYREAVAAVRGAQAGLFPTVTGAPSITRTHAAGAGTNAFTAEGTASWEPDIWGKVRRQIESDVATAQSTAAEFASVRLSAQATLATDYFALRAEDSLQRLYDRTIAEYQHSLTITRNQYAVGVAAKSDVVTAETQLQSTQALAVAVGLSRAKYEHAIALLIGRPPSELSVAVAPLDRAVPAIPASLPSTLLERRPDIAEAERGVQAQSALIGVAVAAYYPTVDLVGIAGLAGDPGTGIFRAGNAVWSVAGSAGETIFDGGARAAAVDGARASYDAAVATYRETVLAAFQDVEDEIASLRFLARQAEVEGRAVASARKAVEIALNEYRAGTQSYTTVVTAQATALADEQTLLAVQSDRVAAAVSLIRALGGGWTTARLPAPKALDQISIRF